MDRKSLVILIASFTALMLWYPLVNRFYPPIPVPKLTNQPPAGALSTNLGSATNAGAAMRETAGASARPTPTPLLSQVPEQTLALENESARYIFTSHGGGLKLIELKQFPATVQCDQRVTTNDNPLATLNTRAPVPAMSILGDPLLESASFRLSKVANGVRAEAVLANGLRVVKDFQLSTNFLLKTVVRFENTTNQPLLLREQELVVGTATPMGKRDESLMLGFQWYNGSKAESVTDAWFANRALGCGPGSPRSEYRGGSSNVGWVSVHNQFFTLTAVPDAPVAQMVGRKVELPKASQQDLEADSKALQQPFGYQAAFLYPSAALPPGQVVEHKYDVYAGPKEYNTLARLGQNLDLIMNFGFFGFFAKALLLSMNGVHALGLSYGVSIVVITVIIKACFWPLTAASTRSMKRMSELQPQMKALQEKYKDDPKKMNAKLMEFMKENKVNPMGGCLPMMLQIPVFIGFYTMLQSAIELRGASFLWACDLSQPDTIFHIPGLAFPVNPMPLIMGATMLWQAQLTPPSPGMDPAQQRIMKYMPLMFMVFLYNNPAGLTLYWSVQNLISIAQMKLTKASNAKNNGGKPGPAPRALAPKR